MLGFPHYIAYNLLFADLLHKFVYIEDAPYFIFPLLIPVILWQISRYFFKGKVAFIPSIIIILSPWFWYLTEAHSFYIFLTFEILSLIYGIVLTKSGKIVFGNFIVILSAISAIYVSSIFFVLVPFSLLLLLTTKIIGPKEFKIAIIGIIIFTIPLLFLIGNNKTNFRNSLNLEIKVFSDPGIINTVNRYQGAAGTGKLRYLAKISENKFIFYSEFFAMKYIDQFLPVTIFTPQYRLLEFSFNPPVLLGFAIPFVYGLFILIQNQKLRKLFFVSTLLLIPSLLANTIVALNRLLLFLPVIAIIISYGFMKLSELRRKSAQLFLTITLLLIVFQSLVMIFDIRFRENQRKIAYLGKITTLVEP